MSVERHQLHEEDTGAYLLCALSDVEEQRFEAHLEQCAVCQDEVARLRPAVDALPRSVYPVPAPPSLKQGLMAAAERDVRERDAAEGRGPGVLARARERLHGVATPFAGLRPAAALVGASVILMMGFIGGAAGPYALDGARQDGEPPLEALVAKVDKTRLPSASGSMVVPEGRRTGAVLRVHGMPELEGDSIYQVWVRRKGEVISQSLFHVGSNGDGAAAVTENLREADLVMVTREAAGGAKAPTEKPVLSVRL